MKQLVIVLILMLFLAGCGPGSDEDLNDTYTILDAHVDKVATPFKGTPTATVTAQGKQYELIVTNTEAVQLRKQVAFAQKTDADQDLKFDIMVSGTFTVKTIALSRARQH